MTLGLWLRRQSLIAYFALAYGISWSGIVIVLGVSGFDLTDLRPLDTCAIFVLMALDLIAGGLASTTHLEGRAGLRQLWSSLARWQVGTRGCALALLTLPAVLLAVLSPLRVLLDAAFAPRFQCPLLAIERVTGAFEEVGWTGFATPRLFARHQLFATGLSSA